MAAVRQRRLSADGRIRAEGNLGGGVPRFRAVRDGLEPRKTRRLRRPELSLAGGAPAAFGVPLDTATSAGRSTRSPIR